MIRFFFRKSMESMHTLELYLTFLNSKLIANYVISGNILLPVSPFIVVPGNYLDHIITHDHGQ